MPRMAYSGNSGRVLSSTVRPKDYCHSWKAPSMKEARRTDRQEARASIREELELEQKRERLTAHIRRQEQEWARLFALIDEM